MRTQKIPSRNREEEPKAHSNFGVGGRVFMGAAFGVLLVAGVGGWAAHAPLSGAVIAQGSVTVDRNLKSLQHRDGGIVSKIDVREGDVVQAGDVLLTLDDLQTRAELSIVRAQLVELKARKARLMAEREGRGAIEFPPDLDLAQFDIAFIANGESRLFAGNLAHRESQKQQLELGIAQIGEELNGLDAQKRSKVEEIALVFSEDAKVKGLAEKGLIEGPRVYTVSRERARLVGEGGEIDASIARAKAKISEVRLQIIAIDENARTEAQRELSLIETKMSELNDRRIAIEDRLLRTEIRAPIAGTVHELNIHTIGGVITPAEVLVTLVPENARLKIESRIPPASIDQVAVGQAARLRFSAFNQRTTPELNGHVVHVTPATSRDNKTGEAFYLANIEIAAEELAKLGDNQLVPGMPVEVFIQTEQRTALSYLVKPLTDQFEKAFRER